MGLLQGTMSIRMYRVEGELPKKYREEFLEEIQRNAFRELGPEKEFGVGWVSPANFLDTDFEDGKVFQNQYLTTAMRVDKKAVNARLFRALFERELEKFKAESNREKVKPSEKREIKERLRRKLLAQAEPNRKTFDLCWDTGQGRLYFFGTSDRLQDLFREQFWNTFHLEPVMLTVKARFEAAAGQAVPPDIEDPGREFLNWLFWRTDNEGGKFELPKSGEVHLWVDDRMLFKDATEKPTSTALTGGDPARWPEARASLANEKRLTKVKLGLRRGEREWSFTLDGETLDLTTLKIPALLTDAEDEVLFERLALLEEAAFVVEELFAEYVERRLSDEWERKDQAWMARWVAEGAPAGAVAAAGTRKLSTVGAARRSRTPVAVKPVARTAVKKKARR